MTIRKSEGFALIDVLFVCAIMGVLATIALPRMLMAKQSAGAASAISETSSELGGALGIAVLGSIGGVVYREMMLNGVPAGVPVSVAQSARGTLGAAVAAAAALPGATGSELVLAARAAFSHSFEVVALISAAIALGTAVMTAVLLRRPYASA